MIIKRLSTLLIISFYPNLINSQYDYSYSADDEDFLPKLSDYNGSGGGGKNLPNYYDTDNYGDKFAPIDEEVVGGNDDSEYNASGDYNDQYENNQKNDKDYDPYGFSSNNNVDEVITSYDSSTPVVPNEKEIDTKQEVDEVIEDNNLIEEPEDSNDTQNVDQNEDYYDSNNYEDLPIDPVNQPDDDDDDNIETLDQFDENNFYDEDNDNTDENIKDLTNFTDNYDDDDNFEILDNDPLDETPDYKDGPKIIEITESDKNIGPVVKQTTINDDSSNEKELSNGGFNNNPVVKFFKDIFNFQFEGDFWSEKYFLAALLCGAFVGFLIIAIVIGFICHSIRKADEGSYIIDKTLRYNEEYTRDSLLQNAMNSNNKFQVNPSQTMGNQEYFA